MEENRNHLEEEKELMEEEAEKVSSEIREEAETAQEMAGDIYEEVSEKITEAAEAVDETAEKINEVTEEISDETEELAENVTEEAERIFESDEADEAIEASKEAYMEFSETNDSTMEEEENSADHMSAFDEIKTEEKQPGSLYQKKEAADGSYHFSYHDLPEEKQIPKKTASVTEPKKKKGGWLKKLGIGMLVFLLGGAGGFAGTKLALKNVNTEPTVIYQSTPTQVVYTTSESGAASVSDVYDMTADTVVEITTEKVVTGYWMNSYVTQGAGSGVIISSDGYILTCNHVIDGAKSITVITTDGSSYEASVVGTDAENDIAVLKINATNLQSAVLGDSDSVRVGEQIVAIGNPLGELGGSTTTGIVSAKSRNVTIEGTEMNVMQIDAAVNPGNSGGALFNMYGELIGIVNAKEVDEDVEGIGFAIPINNVKSIISDLVTKGYVSGKRTIGIKYADISSPRYAEYYGLDRDVDPGIYIVEVMEGSLAEELGIQAGDRIVSINGLEVNELDIVGTVYSNASIGDLITFVFERDGSEITISFNKD